MIWVAVCCCLVVSFIFSGIEAGILSMNRVRLRHQVKSGDPLARSLEELLAEPERLLVTVVVVTNLMNVTALILTTEALVHSRGTPGYFLAAAIFLPLNLFLLEVLPKSLFRRMPYGPLLLLARPLQVADWLLTPMHFVGWRLTRFLFGKRPPAHRKLFVAREEFKYFTAESEKTGSLTSTERKMIHNVIDFRAVTARDVMTPASNFLSTPGRATIGALLARSQETGLERWPVLDDQGIITGQVDAFDLALEKSRTDRLYPHQRRILRVAPAEPAYAILRQLRAARVNLAVVTEDGRTPVGLVTTEDLVRRLVDTAAAPRTKPTEP